MAFARCVSLCKTRLAVAILATNQPDNSATAMHELRTPNTFAAGAPLLPGTTPLLSGESRRANAGV